MSFLLLLKILNECLNINKFACSLILTYWKGSEILRFIWKKKKRLLDYFFTTSLSYFNF